MDDESSDGGQVRGQLLQCLLTVREHVEAGTVMDGGICSNVARACARAEIADVDEVLDALSDALIALGLDTTFPVPAPSGFRPDAESREILAYSALPFWTGEYGRERIALLDRLIDHLHS